MLTLSSPPGGATLDTPSQAVLTITEQQEHTIYLLLVTRNYQGVR